MSNPARTKQIRKAALQTLAQTGGYALPVESLWSFVDDLVKPPLTFGEKGVTEKFLIDGQFVRLVPDSLDPILKQCVITELGRNLLASL